MVQSRAQVLAPDLGVNRGHGAKDVNRLLLFVVLNVDVPLADALATTGPLDDCGQVYRLLLHNIIF
jgi:hypothetical protein